MVLNQARIEFYHYDDTCWWKVEDDHEYIVLNTFSHVQQSSNDECRDWKLLEQRLQDKPINVLHIFVLVCT